MGKVKKQKKPKMEVEDHGNGYMVIGTPIVKIAQKELRHYVEDSELYSWACPTRYNGRSAVWLTTGPGQNWEGSKDALGNPLPR